MSFKYTGAEIKNNTSRLSRETVCNALKIEEGISRAWAAVQSASPKELELFQRDPQLYGPTFSAAKLDTSAQTAAKAKSSDWNLILISILAGHAQSQAAEAKNPAEYGHPGHIIQWEKLISSRINRILDDLYKSRPKGDEHSNAVAERMHSRAEANRIASRKRATRLWKYERRLKQATLEQGKCCEMDDQEGEKHWEFILFATSVLGLEGMSDEEDGEENGEAIRLVCEVSFRHQEFRSLYRHSDTIGNKGEDGFGLPTGRKFKKRVEIPVTVRRKPPTQLPSAFHKQESERDANETQLEQALMSTSEYFRCRAQEYEQRNG